MRELVGSATPMAVIACAHRHSDAHSQSAQEKQVRVAAEFGAILAVSGPDLVWYWQTLVQHH